MTPSSPLACSKNALATPLLSSNMSIPPRTSWAARLVCVAALAVGAVVAYASQSILMQLLWKDSILVDSESSIGSVILFSLHWSFWTCVILLTTLLTVSNAVEYVVSNAAGGTCTSNRLHSSEDFMFQLESHYVLGALLTISAVWLLDTNVTTRLSLHNTNDDMPSTIWTSSFILTAILMMGYSVVGWYAYCCLTNHSASSSSSSTHPWAWWHTSTRPSWWTWCWTPQYRCATATTMLMGVGVGSTSQFVLCYFLWDGRTHAVTNSAAPSPVISSLLLFSLVWSALTVGWTAMGCALLTNLVPRLSRTAPNVQTDPRTLLRMEAVYIGCCLVGICGAWITIDISHHMLEQVLPSILLLGVSMVAFAAILQCFPEDDCLDIHMAPSSDEHDDLLETTTRTSGLTVAQVV